MPEPTAALAAVRNYCGWHVTPERKEELILDGPGGRLLFLPTLRLVDLVAVTENGAPLDVGVLDWSGRGIIAKRAGTDWTDRFRGVTVEIQHGFDSAPDFDKAVEIAAQALSAAEDRRDPAMTVKQIDDVRYQWDSDLMRSLGVEHLLASYRLEPEP